MEDIAYPLRSAENMLEPIDRRQQILNAALKIIAMRGIHASIAEIAATAGVTDSTIYRYFKNKRDLLFYAAAECLRKKTEDLRIQLTGIREPISRLSKLIWFLRLYNVSEDAPYVKFTLFECRPQESFNKHEAFRHSIHFALTVEEILRDGVRQGVFWSQLNVPVARDMICGLLEMENIQFYVDHRPETGPGEFDDLIDLVLRMLDGRNGNKREMQGKKEIILDAAESLFAQLGYEKATTIEIAKSAGVAEATLYEYFKGKENILFSDLQYRIEDHLESLRGLSETKTAVARFQRFIRNFFITFLSRPSFAKILITEGIYNMRFYQTTAYDHFQRYLQEIDLILEQGQRERSIRSGIKPHIVKNLLLGFFSASTLRVLYLENCGQQGLLEEIDATVSLLLRAVEQPGGSCENDT